jgi:hypothetical protein
MIAAVDPGAVLIVVAVVVFVPLVLAGGLVVAAVLGWALTSDAEATHEGSELIALNR